MRRTPRQMIHGPIGRCTSRPHNGMTCVPGRVSVMSEMRHASFATTTRMRRSGVRTHGRVEPVSFSSGVHPRLRRHAVRLHHQSPRAECASSSFRGDADLDGGVGGGVCRPGPPHSGLPEDDWRDSGRIPSRVSSSRAAQWSSPVRELTFRLTRIRSVAPHIRAI